MFKQNDNLLARTATDLRLQLVVDHASQYNRSEIELIIRSIITAHEILGATTSYSRAPMIHHFLGTASLVMKMGLSADYVAFACMHSIYLQIWPPHLKELSQRMPNNLCSHRKYLQEATSETAEELIW